MQLASLADMGVSLPGINKLLFFVCLLCVYLLVFSSVGRIVGVSELCSYVVFTPFTCLACWESNSGDVVCQLA